MLIGQEPLVPPPGVHTFPQETPAPKRVLGPGGQPLLRDYLALGSHSFARDAHPGMFEGLGAAGEQAGSRARGVVITVGVDSGAA